MWVTAATVPMSDAATGRADNESESLMSRQPTRSRSMRSQLWDLVPLALGLLLMWVVVTDAGGLRTAAATWMSNAITGAASSPGA